MQPSLHCPCCSRPIAPLHRRSLQEAVTCQACGKQYGVVYGKLSRRSSVQEALLYLKASLPSVYKRHYTLHITTADRTLKRLQFSVPGKADVIPAHRGDLISVLYTMQGYVLQKLVAIANHTTGNHYVLERPIASTNHHIAILLTLVSGFLTVSFFSGMNVILALVLGAIGVLTYVKVTHAVRLSSPALESQDHEGMRLLADQRLMVQQGKITQRIGALQHEGKANHVLIRQLEALKQKMARLDSAMYSARLDRATTAINILKQQIANNQRLVQEYERTLTMIEIEIDTSWIADQLPDAENFTRKILERLAELKEIEDQNQSLKLQLAAYEEVNLFGIDRYDGGTGNLNP